MNTRDKISEYVNQCIEKGRYPTIREIGRHVGIKSTSHISYHLKRLNTPQSPKYPKIFSSNLREIREKIIDMMGGKCFRCGFSDIRALQIDHVNGDGSKERKERKQRGMYFKMYSEVKSGNLRNYQVLCANCNWIKRYENGETRKYKTTES